jgi:hypothetical protein
MDQQAPELEQVEVQAQLRMDRRQALEQEVLLESGPRVQTDQLLERPASVQEQRGRQEPEQRRMDQRREQPALEPREREPRQTDQLLQVLQALVRRGQPEHQERHL